MENWQLWYFLQNGFNKSALPTKITQDGIDLGYFCRIIFLYSDGVQ